MKRIKTIYWIITGLFAALMLLSAIPSILMVPKAVDMTSKHLGYPLYFIPFLGVAKLLGVVGILTPGFPRIKEWAYAGFIFDLIAAAYSIRSVGDPIGQSAGALLGLILAVASYALYHKTIKGTI
jgi:hypothetical protein